MTNTSKRVQRLLEKQIAKTQEENVLSSVAVGYIRVSTEEQVKKGYGLESQEKAIRAFALSQGYELLTVIADKGVSGATNPLHREGFREVHDLAQERAFSILLVWKIDRLARSLIHAVTTTNTMREEHNVVLRSVTGPIDTSSAMGQTIFAILAGMAQQERQVITERTIAGRKAKASKGGFAGGGIPYGYVSDGKKGLAICEREAVVIRDIFRDRSQGRTLKEIADGLNQQDVPTARGGRWHPATIRYILDNPKYRGDVEYLFRWNGDAGINLVSTGTHKGIL